MLTTWLTEIFLNSLGVLKDSGKREEFEQTRKDFRDFLASETLKVGGAGGRGRGGILSGGGVVRQGCGTMAMWRSALADSRCSVVCCLFISLFVCLFTAML